MKELSLFTGAGGGLLGTKLLGFTHIGYVEINDYCQRIIKQRIEDGILDRAPIFGDIKTFISDGYAESYQGMVDVVTGGFPCQDLSVAGRGEGLEGSRSGLWESMADVIRRVRPRKVFVENSPALTFRGLGVVLRDLAAMGFNARWCVLGASDLGAPHKRKRIWIMADTDKMGGKICNKPFTKRSLPRNWVDIAPYVQKAPISGDIRSINGVADWSHRIGAIGNGQVPVVAKTAWELLTGLGY